MYDSRYRENVLEKIESRIRCFDVYQHIVGRGTVKQNFSSRFLKSFDAFEWSSNDRKCM